MIERAFLWLVSFLVSGFLITDALPKLQAQVTPFVPAQYQTSPWTRRIVAGAVFVALAWGTRELFRATGFGGKIKAP